ncbi:MAG: 30S ribosomal protein S8 [Proteobacteria bacterium]|nr:30S ribosomal protein S8 [Pseudomonadota bacterium]
MNITDPIADYLTRIRNAQKAEHRTVVVPASRLKIALTFILKHEGFIHDFKCFRDNKQGLIKIALKYQGGQGMFQKLLRQSKPGRRVYVSAKDIPYVKNGFGFAILSTSSGVMTCREARKRGVGGEYLCSIF